MNLRKKIKEDVRATIIKLQEDEVFSAFDIPDIQILKPKNDSNGDYSLSIGMEIAKILKGNPLEIAQIIIDNLGFDQDIFSKIEAVSPGFINLYLVQGYLISRMQSVLQNKESFGCQNIGQGMKVQVEFVSANPTGPLTVGNGRGGPFGDTLSNVLNTAGYEVEKAYYINDYGKQVLSLGHSVLKDEEAKYTGDYIDDLHNRFKDMTDPYLIGKASAQIILEECIRKTTDNLNINYNEWFSETFLHESGLVSQTVEYLQSHGFTYEKDGAIWLRSSDYGDERDRVLVRSDKTMTYLAGDLAYHRHKFESKGFDKVINVWGADHFGDVPGIMAGMEMLGFKDNERIKLEIILLQFVTVMKDGKPVKMSKRLGTAITMDDLLDELPTDVIRFFFLQKSANTHLNFDINLAKEQSDKNPVFYVQYAHARICSILASGGVDWKDVDNIQNPSLLTDERELNLMRKILRWEEIIEDTAIDYQVHRIPQYSLELASAFHQFYSGCHCLVDDSALREARLGLLVAAKTTLANSLRIMGISTPEKM
ncbi:MAG: arginine--tRNA ligase [Minisyncoccus archaeiphilus]|uniref:arginine--tRNA ligase n=1 Tax=Minisyncoccus archaeiphilus TaxID=3238481 RepID=UPI002B081DCB|nr:MAG: arginine--tRNA ligase [Candidatus Parcubacteria bacterium]